MAKRAGRGGRAGILRAQDIPRLGADKGLEYKDEMGRVLCGLVGLVPNETNWVSRGEGICESNVYIYILKERDVTQYLGIYDPELLL